MFSYTICYKHTWGGDEVRAWSKKGALKKAIKILKNEFSEKDFPLTGQNVQEKFIAYTHADLIEEIIRN